MTSEFYFLRHGETDWNLTGQLQGHIDVPLNEKGLAQAHSSKNLVQSLPIGAVWHSDLGRATQTAQIVCDGTNWQLTKSQDLRPPHFGSNTGLTEKEIRQNYQDNPNNYVLSDDGFPYAIDGEHSDASYTRITDFTKLILTTQPLVPLFVSHGEMFRALMMSWRVISDRKYPKNCQPYHFYQQSGVWYCREVEKKS